jgi:leucyl/phenylalanyl-tRNA--protein transferase
LRVRSATSIFRLVNVVFPPPAAADEHGRVFVGGDLGAETLVTAYRSGLFPMRQSNGDLTWWSPDPRGILAVDALRVSDSLRRSRRRFEIRVDTSFDEVVAACADRKQEEYDWITPEIREAYGELHRLGVAHSVEAWRDGELAGGLYGVAIGGLFAGESMFHRERDASKAALVALVEILRDDGRDGAGRIVDLQWLTPHLASLGGTEIPRREYLERLEQALELPPPSAFGGHPRLPRGGTR